MPKLSKRAKSLEEMTQALQLIAHNPDILAKNPDMLSQIVDKVSQDMEISVVSFKPSRQDVNQVSKQMEENVDVICGKIRQDVLKQVRSEIAGLFGTARSQLSTVAMMQAMSESIKKLSLIREVRAVYVFTEPENLRFVVIHDSMDRIDVLRKVVEIENGLDADFEDLYFEFSVLHRSEVNDDLIRDALLIFERT
jgi:predicted secreted protein